MKFICEKYPCYKICSDAGYIEFKKNEYETTDKKEIALLKTITDVKVVDEAKIK